MPNKKNRRKGCSAKSWDASQLFIAIFFTYIIAADKKFYFFIPQAFQDMFREVRKDKSNYRAQIIFIWYVCLTFFANRDVSEIKNYDASLLWFESIFKEEKC